MSHTLLYVGSYNDVVTTLDEVSDCVSYNLATLDVDTAREIAERTTRKVAEHAKRRFIISFSRATSSAQNALLKSLEEPARGIEIIVIVPRADILIPTVRSRLMFVKAIPIASEYDDFMELSLKERLAKISDVFSKTKQDDGKEEVEQFSESVLCACEKRAQAHATSDPEYLRDVLFVRSYFDRPGASRKMLLEFLMWG